MRVVVLGAGFGGLEVSTALAERLGERVEVTLVDRREGFTFGFSKPPNGTFEMPSAELAAHEAEFGASRVRRWFGRECSPMPTVG